MTATKLHEAVTRELDAEIRDIEGAIRRIDRLPPGEWEAGMKGRVSGLQYAQGILSRKLHEINRGG